MKFPFEVSGQFRILDAPQRYSGNPSKSSVKFAIKEWSKHKRVASFLVYDPPSSNGRLLPARYYSCSMSPHDAEYFIDVVAVQNRLMTPREYGKFVSARSNGYGKFLLARRKASSLFLEQVVDSIKLVDNEKYHSPNFRAKVMEGIPPELADFHYISCGDPVHSDEFSGKESHLGKTLNKKQQKELFMFYNGARYHFKQEALLYARDKLRDLTDLRTLEKRVAEAKDALTNANLPLVLAMIRRTRFPNVHFSELVSEGNMALLKSIEGFDISLGYKFSTYACRAILKAFFRASMKQSRYSATFPFSFEPSLEKGDCSDLVREAREDFYLQDLREINKSDFSVLSPVERVVIKYRFALSGNGDVLPEPETLEKVGQRVGITREIVRQIQNKALKKLREELMRREEEHE